MKYKNIFKKKFLISVLVLFVLVTAFYSWLTFFYAPSTYSVINKEIVIWDGTVATDFARGNGTSENPYQISNGNELAYLRTAIESDASYSTSYYKITKDIDLGTNQWHPINNFSGNLDGQGHTINNINITQNQNITYYGLFSSTTNSSISNLNIQNTNITVGTSGSIAGNGENVTINNVSVRNVTATGGMFGNLSGTINNCYANSNNNGSIANVLSATVNNVITNKSIYNTNNSSTITNVYYYNESLTLDGNVVSETDLLNTLNNNYDYEWYIESNQLKIKAKTLLDESLDMTLHATGIDGNNVYINNLDADWNYYMGLNYTYSETGTIPNGNNQNIYNENNLVRLQVNYSGTQTLHDNSTLTGHISTTELQDNMIYYKVLSVNNNGTTNTNDDYVKLELIDNPFTDRPNDLAFNNWVTNYRGVELEYDYDYYKRYAIIPITYTNGTPNQIVINFTPTWVMATTSSVNGNWQTAFNNLNNSGMKKLEFYITYHDSINMAGYYHSVSVSWYSSVAGYYNSYGEYQSRGYCTSWSGCTYYDLIDDEEYDENSTYYTLKNGRMATVNESELDITWHTEIDSKYIEANMSGYYRPINISRNKSIAGYYNSNGELLSGNCTQTTCSCYELINYYDNYGNQEIRSSNEEYYYLVTRDTNILVMNSDISSAWSSNQNKPFTLTGVYNDIDNNPTWNVSGTSVRCYADTAIENLTIYSGQSSSNSSPTGSTGSSRYLYGNFYNVKVGRGIKAQNNYKNFMGIIGGSNGSINTLTKYNLIIESGYYNTFGIVNGALSNGTDRVEAKAVYGNDYDRANNDNYKLDVYYCAAGSWGGDLYANNQQTGTAIELTVKSGSFGTGKYDHTTGIYIGGRSYGDHYAARKVIYESGYTYNLIGGPLSADNRGDINDIYAYIKGGTIDMVTMGAGTSATYGNRIASITGGTINYSVFGGSNGYNGDSSDGTLIGDSFIYVGGNATIGSGTNSTLFGSESGSVFGIGNGRSGYTAIGSSENSNIVIDGNAVIKNNIYGGGNYGATGISGTISTTTNIKINGGTVNGSIYGGGNRNGSGSTSISSTVNIIMTNGTVNGSIYGGSNESGTIYGNVDIDILGGTINNDVYGGGKGGYINDSSRGTYVTNNIDIFADNNNHIDGSIYGGSAYGSVKNIDITVDNGVISNSVFGGGKGNATYTPVVSGNINVNINGGNIAHVYGGNDASGVPNGTVLVYLNGGTIGNAFGGGNNSSLPTTNIYLKGATVTNLFGGSNNSGNVTTSNVTIDSGNATTIYGGNNAGGSTLTSNVNVNGGTIGSVFGGGNSAVTTNTNLNLNGASITNAYGGGNLGNVTTPIVNLNGATITNLFGSGAFSGASTTTINLTKGTVTNLYGGSNQSGDVSSSTITTNGTDLNITNLYGGNNIGGVTSTTNINISAGSFTNVYGGGNNAITNSNNLNITGGTITTLYGGGNKASTNGNTIVNLTDSNILDSVYAGGNLGNVIGNTTLNVVNSSITNNVYGGGNNADVTGSSLTNVSGNTNIGKNLFGGGNSGTIGLSTTNNSTSVVNITGAVVGSNVYGGCNTSVVYGSTFVNIGKDAVTGDLVKGDINISGTVFGGGEANASGSEIYDFSFICVTVGLDININGNGYLDDGYTFNLSGSIFGSGNASSSSGTSNIYIANLGTKNSPSKNISIQRTDRVILDHSYIELSGATDRTNEYSSIKYSLNRIDSLKIKNNSTLLLQQNANLLKRVDSVVDVDGNEQKANVVINDEDKTVTKNVDNRIYLLANKNLNITTDETASTYGVISGMTFFGMYTSYSNGTFAYGLYDDSFSYGSSASARDVVTGGSYILGLHSLNHDITVDGFYTNYIDDDYTVITTSYINPTPPTATYYMWTIGIQAINYSFGLTASKYSSLGTYELSLLDFSSGDTTFEVLGFNVEGLTDGVSLVDSNNVPKIARAEVANSVLGLSMKSETTEWTGYNTTKFLSNNSGSYSGDHTYKTDSQSSAASLMFYLYHAKNISLDQNLGVVVITLQAMTPKNEIEYDVQLITITIELDARTYSNGDAYDASIAYDRKYDIPAATAVNITNKSQFTTYFSLYADATSVNSFYGLNNDYYHALVSNTVLPIGTTITMIDYGASDVNPEYYYYTVDENSYNDAVSQLNMYNEVAYNINKFIKMDSVDSTNTYNDSSANVSYFHSEEQLVMEEFLFIFDFKDTALSGNHLNNTILFELRNNESRALVTVLGIRQPLMNYNLYETSNVVLSEQASISNNYVYYKNNTSIPFRTIVSYDQTNNRTSIIDTNYESISMGLNAYILDGTNIISSTLLTGTSLTIDGNVYFASGDGVFRIKLANKVSNLNKNIILSVNNGLPPGNYILRLVLFASSDGLHNSSGLQDDTIDFNITVVGDDNSIAVTAPLENRIVDGTTGLNSLASKNLNYVVNYDSVLSNPNIRFSVYKRKVDSYSTIEYDEIDSRLMFANTFTFPASYGLTSSSLYEYMVTNSPKSANNFSLILGNDLISGTYKVVFKLYDFNYLVDTDTEYVIIKKGIE